LIWASASCAAAPQLYRESRRIMGTFCEVQAYDSNPARARAAIAAALDEMARVDRLLSNYDPSSELSIMNREAGRAPFHVPAELFRFITACRQYYENTSGTFDPAVGSLVRVWGFFSRHPGMPAAAEIAAAKATSGFDKIQLNDIDETVRYTAPGLEMDPGGVGKGYAVDRAVAILRRWHVRSALVSAGGSSLYGLGHPPGRRGWRVAISNPSNPGRALAFVQLRDNSLSTSGVAEQSVTVGSRRYSHIFDPRTGAPVENMCQVTVVAPGGMETDALTKPAFILSREHTIEVLKHYPDAHALRLEGACDAASPIWITPWSSKVFSRLP
jgi:thiamine biosynthesis lipoprotein